MSDGDAGEQADQQLGQELRAAGQAAAGTPRELQVVVDEADQSEADA